MRIHGQVQLGIKNLSVNNINLQRHFAERDDGGGQMIQADEAAFQLFIAHQQLAEAVQPTVRNLYNPAPRFLAGNALQILLLLMAAFDVRDVTVQLNQLRRGLPGISSIRAQVLRAALGWQFPLDHNLLQHGSELGYIMPIGSGHDER